MRAHRAPAHIIFSFLPPAARLLLLDATLPRVRLRYPWAIVYVSRVGGCFVVVLSYKKFLLEYKKFTRHGGHVPMALGHPAHLVQKAERPRRLRRQTTTTPSTSLNTSEPVPAV